MQFFGREFEFSSSSSGIDHAICWATGSSSSVRTRAGYRSYRFHSLVMRCLLVIRIFAFVAR